jgi:single-stranded DNA-binding protein
MSMGDTTLTVIGNITADPELRFSQVPREFAITEAAVGLNSRVGLR